MLVTSSSLCGKPRRVLGFVTGKGRARPLPLLLFLVSLLSSSIVLHMMLNDHYSDVGDDFAIHITRSTGIACIIALMVVASDVA